MTKLWSPPFVFDIDGYVSSNIVGPKLSFRHILRWLWAKYWYVTTRCRPIDADVLCPSSPRARRCVASCRIDWPWLCRCTSRAVPPCPVPFRPAPSSKSPLDSRRAVRHGTPRWLAHRTPGNAWEHSLKNCIGWEDDTTEREGFLHCEFESAFSNSDFTFRDYA